MTLAIIPARGGSKRIPKKNIKKFCGEPVIAWSIAAAIESECFDQIIVSTDNEEIAEIARRNGAEIPFMRPPYLADDFTPTIPVVRHAIEYTRLQGKYHKLVCCIYPAAPLISSAVLRQALELLRENQSGFVFPVAKHDSPIQRALSMKMDGTVSMLHPDKALTRSQDLEPTYFDAGQFYWGRVTDWINEETVFVSDAKGIVLPRHLVQDIDSDEDWDLAEMFFQLTRRPN